jgi:putative N-acetyltransferase (TIGR04045 family)
MASLPARAAPARAAPASAAPASAAPAAGPARPAERPAAARSVGPARPAERPAAARSVGPARPAERPAAARRPVLACRAACTAAERAAHFRIRHEVFVVEQGLFRPAGGAADGDDADAHDEDPATIHAVGLADGVICGTVRLYPVPEVPGRWKGDRLAVLPGHRHLGLGAPLVRFAVGCAAARGGREMEAYIQPANVAFFRWLGWQPAGGLVQYAGIPHQRMLIGLHPPARPSR